MIESDMKWICSCSSNSSLLDRNEGETINVVVFAYFHWCELSQSIQSKWFIEPVSQVKCVKTPLKDYVNNWQIVLQRFK